MKIKNFLTILALGTALILASCGQETENLEENELDTTTTSYNVSEVIVETSTIEIKTTSTVENNTTETTSVTTTTAQDVTSTCTQSQYKNDEAVIEILATPMNTEIDYSGVETTGIKIDDYSRTLLAEIVYHEAGCDWIDIYEKARIVAGVMNRVYDERFPSTVYDVLTQEGQFTGYSPGCVIPNENCYLAVDYYFDHPDLFGNENSWYGTGYENIFYYQ